MKKLIVFLFNFCILFVFGKPIDQEKKQLFQKAGFEMTLAPEKASEVLDYLEKNFTLNSEEQQKLDYLRIKSSFFQNNLTDALKKISSSDESLSPDIIILKQSILYYLRIYYDSEFIKASQDKDILFSKEIMTFLNRLNQSRPVESKQELSNILIKAQSCNLMIARESLLYLMGFLADHDRDPNDSFFITSIYNLYKNDLQFKIVYANYLINNNKLEAAKKMISELPKESLEQTTNLNLKYCYYDIMAKLYAKTQAYDNYKETVEKKDLLLKALNQTRFSAKNKWFNILEDNFRTEQESLLKNRKKILFSIVGISTLIIILVVIRFFQINSQVKEYQNFILRINLLKEKKAPQQQAISEKTENILLKKLDDFENTEDYIKTDLSLQSLAKKLETNTKYLSETINTHKQKNFNAYINELRINYIINKLKDKPIYRSYKIKYLAEESGFSTHSAFTAVFKTVTGMSPANYIQLLKQKEE
ncbi:AraC-like DNA-binding protein [Epilithonimonas hungarica]|uniref:helix-turn-helix domain-containing protein n=1 Tax=Epilithonimonas hungarica TaxID=454006 RepID=UPI0012C30FC5|nr:helix-turn-helix domain-containing protein [Epilithonimonas hungarica]MDP9955453.1 AraC-like DNA-binding protein [Epilithonimonas hungarica]MPT31038.1 AraC family transcriptional regulator [Chryseobacterium sp.]